MSKNVRMALLIFLPVSFWFATGVLEEDKIEPPKAQKTLSSVVINESICLLYTSPSPRDVEESRMPSSA